MRGWIPPVYIVIGIIVAYAYHYFTGLLTISNIISMLLAIFLWPLVLLGVNLHIVIAPR